MKYRLFFLFFLGMFVSCKQTGHKITGSGQSLQPQFAQGFELKKYADFDILIVKNAYPGAPQYQYVLHKTQNTLPDSLSDLPVIKIPVQKILVTSTTHLPALEMLGVSNKLIAFPHTKYVSSPVFRRLIEEGKIKEAGKGMELNTEVVLSLQPDLIMRFSSGNEHLQDKVFNQNNIPTIYNADWMENNPLGRAEWIKVFGWLFDKEKKAYQIFDTIVSRYQNIKTKVLHDSLPVPRVFQGGLFGDKWFVPGGKSYAAQLINDAGAKYLWNKDTHTGSVQVNFENVLLSLPQADIWLNPGMYPDKQNLLKSFPALSKFKVYQNDKIYTYNLTRGVTGGVIYFEQSNAHPDWVLEDLYHIFYPVDKQYQFHFYQQLP